MANPTSGWNANSDLIVGNDLWLYLVDLGHGASAVPMTYSLATGATAEALAYATSCNFEMNADTLEGASKMSCRFSISRAGQGSYNVTADALYCVQANAAANGCKTVDDLFEAFIKGDNVGWVMAVDKSRDEGKCGVVEGPDATYPLYWGEASIGSLSITGGNNEICSTSISLTGSGAPHKGNDEE